MNRSEILEKVISVFHYVFDNNDLTINEQTTSGDIEDWDSLAHINLIGICELKFSIKFGINEFSKLKSVSDFVDLIEKRLLK